MPATESGRSPDSPILTAYLAFLSGSFLLTATLLALSGPSPTGPQWTALLLLVVLYAVAYRTEFHFPGADSVPTQPLLIAMLFMIPLEFVPAAVLAGQLISQPPSRGSLWEVTRPVLVTMLSSWHSLGPVVVLLLFQPAEPSLSHWPIYLFALGAQFLLDGALTLLTDFLMSRFNKEELFTQLWSFAVDTCLAALGLIAVLAGDGTLVTIVLVSAPVALIAMLIPPRRELVEDLDALNRDAESARDEARIDAMTGLGNRRAWEEALERAQTQHDAQPNLHFGVIAADLNGLKFVNDTYGHEMGDVIISQFADVLRTVAPRGSTICRIGGDEFTLLIRSADGPIDLPDVVNLIQREAARTPPTSGSQLSSGLGFAAFPGSVSVADAYLEADLELTSVKAKIRATRPDRRASA